MTVKTLREALERLPDTATVVIVDNDNDTVDIESVSEGTACDRFLLRRIGNQNPLPAKTGVVVLQIQATLLAGDF